MQISLCKTLLLNSIGHDLFKEFVGFNLGSRAAANGIALAKLGAGLITFLELYTTGVHLVEADQAHNHYLEIMKQMDLKFVPESAKNDILKNYITHMQTMAPHRSPVQMLLGEQNTRTLGEVMSGFKSFTTNKPE